MKRLITLPPATARAKAGDAVPRPIAEDLVPLQCLDPLHGMPRGFSLFDKYYPLCVEVIFKSVQKYSKVFKNYSNVFKSIQNISFETFVMVDKHFEYF